MKDEETKMPFEKATERNFVDGDCSFQFEEAEAPGVEDSNINRAHSHPEPQQPSLGHSSDPSSGNSQPVDNRYSYLSSPFAHVADTQTQELKQLAEENQRRLS